MITLTIALLLISLGCEYPSRPTARALFTVNPGNISQYDLQQPNAKYFLPYVLEEISGLSYASPGLIACIQDEEGKIFFYDHRQKKIVNTFRFGTSGDYEGVEIIGDTAYVLKSNGSLFKFDIKSGEDVKAMEIQTKLNKTNEPEGLAYDALKNRLVIMCKNEAGLGKKKRKGRAAYDYDPGKDKLNKEPAFVITKKGIKNFLEQHIDFEYDTNRIKFKPSGIAFHPLDDHYYIIASLGKLILVIDRSGEIKASYPIDPRLLGQPEGICFAPNGDLFISSEGEGDKGYILKFNIKK